MNRGSLQCCSWPPPFVTPSRELTFHVVNSEQRAGSPLFTGRLKGFSMSLVLSASLLAAGCSVGSTDSAPPAVYHETPFRAANFVDPRVGSNKWFPLVPGTQWVREGTTLIGNRVVPHQVITTVTDVIRVIDGVKTVLVYDHSVGAGQVVQESIDYFAQDKDGNIWTLGGATEQYEAGRFVSVDEVWLSGVDGAKPGILMPANPTAATPAWVIAQPPGEDGDAAAFARMQSQECVPFGCYKDVLVIEEGKQSALNNEFKYYVYGAGQIRNEPLGASRHADIELLINMTMLTPQGLAEASAAALRIDRQAAKEWPAVFGKTKATRGP